MALSARSLLSSESALLAVLTCYVVVLGLWPLARLFVESLSPSASGEVLGLLLGQWRSGATQRALFNTLESSLLATLLSVAIGATAAFVLTLTDVRAKAALTFVALLPPGSSSRARAARSSVRWAWRPRRARPTRSIRNGASCW